jgi:hypothetical protein
MGPRRPDDARQRQGDGGSSRKRVDDAKTLGAVDELKSYAAAIDAHADGVHKFIPVFQSLYDSMPDAQKKTADGVFRTRILVAATKRNM